MIPICKHCRKSKVNRPRGLCWSCYYTPGVKDQYPSTSKYARRGEGNFAGPAATPEPTTAAPGTPEKMAVLEARAKAKQSLWHPLDARYPGDPLPFSGKPTPVARPLPATRSVGEMCLASDLAE